LRHRDQDLVHEASQILAGIFTEKLGKRILGPHIPIVARIRNLYYRNILIKIERNTSSSEIKKVIRESYVEFFKDRNFSSIQIINDVDPM
jgi:primosomal protein N' (replication factor Y)